MLNKIKAVSNIFCEYPFRVLILRNTFMLERFVIAEYVITEEDDIKQIKFPEDLELYTICYEVSENRIIVNFRDKLKETLTEYAMRT